MASTGTVTVKILGDAKGLSGALGDAEGRLGKFAKGAGVAFAALGAAAAGIATGLFKIGESFDGQFDKIRVGTGATGEALDGLQGSFKNVLKSVPTDFDSAGTAIADLNTRLGLTGKPLEELSGQFLNLARITDGDVKTSIDNVTRLFGDWGTATEDQAATMDKLYRAAQASGIGIDDLSTSLVSYGAPLRNLGFTFEESTALLSQFNKAGVNTETVFAGLKAGVGKLAKDGEAIPETFRRIVDEITALGPGTEATAKAIELFGQRAGPDLADAIAGGKFEIEDMLAAIEGGEDTIAQAAADTADFGEKWQLIKNRILVGLEPLATKVFDGVGAAMDRLGPHIETLSAWLTENIPPALERLGALFDAWAPRVVGAFSAVSGFVTTWWPAVAAAFGFVQTAAAALAEFFMAHVYPVIQSALALVQAVVGVFVAVVTNLWARFGTHLVQHITTAWNAIRQVIGGALAVIKGIIDVFTGILTGDWSQFWGGIQQIVSGAWNVIQGLVKAAINAVSATIGAGMAALSALWSLAWNALKTFVSAAFGGIASAVSSGISDVLNLIGGLHVRIFDALGDLSTLLYDSGRALLRGLIDGIKSQVGAVKDAVGGVLSSARNLLPFSPAKEGPFSGRGWTLYSGQALAEGLAQGMKSRTGLVSSAAGVLADAAYPSLGMPGVGGAGRPVLAGATRGGIHIENVTVSNGRTFAEEMALAEALYGGTG